MFLEVRGYNRGEFECQEEVPVEEGGGGGGGELGNLVQVSLLSDYDLALFTEESLIHQIRLAQFMSQPNGEVV